MTINKRDDEHVVIKKGWLEEVDIAEPEKEWRPWEDLIKYIQTLFKPDEKVAYVTESYEKDGKYQPKTKGAWDRSAYQLIQQLGKCDNKKGICSVLGDCNTSAGAWIRFNPVDGKGIKNENVTDFRYALVESDKVSIEKQNAIFRELELPIACMVHSGGKSLHAIVRIEAGNYAEYQKRVEFVYSVCEKNGLEIDKQNKNPSRLSRMPGIIRGDKKQFLVATNIGKASFSDWKEWIEAINDDLPEPENMAAAWDNLPELAPPLIDGVLRQGHKMLIAGPSKAGKSFALIEMCIAIAEGRKWLNWDCAKGKVMYVNLELDRASCLHRFKDVYKAMSLLPHNVCNIDIWNLRGKSIPMDKLAPKLIRRAAKKNYIAIIIDPIYKVITGDENSADQMANFCNQFDKVCTELGCSVIYCHHHSKGTQGGKRSMDRASGSGVFARDPDALIDIIELEISEELRKQEENKAVCEVCLQYLKTSVSNWTEEVSQDDECSETAMLRICKNLLSEAKHKELLNAVYETMKQIWQMTAWQVDGTLREFPKFAPTNIWFKYPTHSIDRIGSLADLKAEGTRRNKKKTQTENKKDQKESMEMAFEASSFAGDVTVTAMAEYLGVTEKTIRNRLKLYANEFVIENKIVRKIENN